MLPVFPSGRCGCVSVSLMYWREWDLGAGETDHKVSGQRQALGCALGLPTSPHLGLAVPLSCHWLLALSLPLLENPGEEG